MTVVTGCQCRVCLCVPGSELLLALDAAVTADPAAVAGAVMNKEYMVQLVEVQHQRGAQGGHQFAAILDTDTEKKSPEGESRLRVGQPQTPAGPVAVRVVSVCLCTRCTVLPCKRLSNRESNQNRMISAWVMS